MTQDILLQEEDVDLQIKNGDFVVGDSDQQHVTLIVNLSEGALKQFPLQGVGIIKYSGSTGMGATLKRSIKVKAEADGYQNVEVVLDQKPDGNFDYSISANR